MHLWEFNACVRASNEKRRNDAQDLVATNWQAAALNGAAFAGKLKPLKAYLKNGIEPAKNTKSTPDKPGINKEEFEARLSKAKRKGAQ